MLKPFMPIPKISIITKSKMSCYQFLHDVTLNNRYSLKKMLYFGVVCLYDGRVSL